MDEYSAQENLYLNRSELNVEKLVRERKFAKLVIFFASVGVLAGGSASFMFFFHYKLVATPLLALFSGKSLSKSQHLPYSSIL